MLRMKMVNCNSNKMPIPLKSQTLLSRKRGRILCWMKWGHPRSRSVVYPRGRITIRWSWVRSHNKMMRMKRTLGKHHSSHSISKRTKLRSITLIGILMQLESNSCWLSIRKVVMSPIKINTCLQRSTFKGNNLIQGMEMKPYKTKSRNLSTCSDPIERNHLRLFYTSFV